MRAKLFNFGHQRGEAFFCDDHLEADRGKLARELDARPRILPGVTGFSWLDEGRRRTSPFQTEEAGKLAITALASTVDNIPKRRWNAK